ncbi:hypothetical protein FJT64_024760 [Amphibalanus amphitrite]|uniref:Uncharacterized protein n=1 Tax=Amphibalanus amphitrite TaxID=1232801 RepID=A0A6A4WDG2_AMPAM|nr:hypothetical protein FJT64_024760 [Amphibalanus amphitrite]
MDRLSLTLTSCNNVMSGISPGARETDHPKTMRKIIEKLPYNLQDQWRRLADHIHEQEHRRARFEDIVDFVEREQCYLYMAWSVVNPADLAGGEPMMSPVGDAVKLDVTPLTRLLTESDLESLLGDPAAVAAWWCRQLRRPPAEPRAGPSY